MRRHGALLVVLAGLPLGCDDETDDTCAVSSADLSLVAVVVDNGPKIRAEIDFERGDRTTIPSPLHVCGNEALTIDGKAPTVTEKPDRIVYSVTLPSDTSREVSFVLQRVEGEPIEVQVDLPPPFEITAPEQQQEVSRSEDLLLSWSPALDMGELRVNVDETVGYGLCVITQEGEHHYKTKRGVPVPDQGQWTIPADVISSETPMPCPAFYTLRRILRRSTPDTLSPGGFVEGRVERTVEIRSVP